MKKEENDIKVTAKMIHIPSDEDSGTGKSLSESLLKIAERQSFSDRIAQERAKAPEEGKSP